MSDKQLLNDISLSCIKYADSKGVSFIYKSKPLSYEEVFADFGLLPGVMKRANKISSVSIGSALGGVFTKEERSYLGYKIEIPELSVPVPLAMLFIIDVLEELIGSSKPGTNIVLDDFTYE